MAANLFSVYISKDTWRIYYGFSQWKKNLTKMVVSPDILSGRSLSSFSHSREKRYIEDSNIYSWSIRCTCVWESSMYVQRLGKISHEIVDGVNVIPRWTRFGSNRAAAPPANPFLVSLAPVSTGWLCSEKDVASRYSFVRKLGLNKIR